MPKKIIVIFTVILISVAGVYLGKRYFQNDSVSQISAQEKQVPARGEKSGSSKKPSAVNIGNSSKDSLKTLSQPKLPPLEDEIYTITDYANEKDRISDIADVSDALSNAKVGKSYVDEVYQDALAGNSSYALSLLNAYTKCFFNGIDSQNCTYLHNAISSGRSDVGVELLRQLEEHAAKGNRQAQKDFWGAVKLGVLTGLINPAGDPISWAQMRNRALQWQVQFSRSGSYDSSLVMALEYIGGDYVKQSSFLAGVFAMRADDLSQGSNAASSLLEEVVLDHDISYTEIKKYHDSFFDQ